MEESLSLPEKLLVLYYLSAVSTLVLGFWLGHVVTLRSWVSWWGDVSPFIRASIRQVLREELQPGKEDR